MLTILNML